jgi:hypothetical protein
MNTAQKVNNGQVLSHIVRIHASMPLRTRIAVAAAIILGAAAPSFVHPQSTQTAKPWQQIPVPKLHEFKPQQPKRIELKNGIVVFLQEDHELPFISGSVLIPGGSRDVEPGKTGLVDLYGEAWRTSGTEKMNGDAMDDFLEASCSIPNSARKNCVWRSSRRPQASCAETTMKAKSQSARP